MYILCVYIIRRPTKYCETNYCEKVRTKRAIMNDIIKEGRKKPAKGK